MRAIIIDDESDSRKTLRNFLQLFCPDVEVIGEAENVASGVKLLKEKQPDVLFLDIQMPDGTGFNLLEQIQPISFDVIFSTAYDQFALKAFEYSAVDYLLKPIDPDKLIQAVNKIKPNSTQEINQKIDTLLDNYQKKEAKKIGLPYSEGIEFIEIKNILRCEAADNYTNFILTDGRLLIVSKNISSFEKMLPAQTFHRIHKSHLINLVHLKKYVRSDGGYVIMMDGSELPIARRRKDEFLEQLKNFM